MTALPHLLSPGRIGKMELRNRMIVTAMGVNLAEPDGFCSDRIRAFHEEHAKGGAALIITGVAGVAWPVGGNQPGQVAFSDDRFIPGLRAIADAVHRHGARMGIQLHHGGRVGAEDMAHGRPLWVPSEPVPEPGDGAQQVFDAFTEEEIAKAMSGPRMPPVTYKVLTKEDIALVVQQFAAAAVRAREAGADGVEIHGGHGYLLSSFASPKYNRRNDEYGGCLENRMRLSVEVLTTVRKAVGPDFPVWVKIDSQEYGCTHGITLADAMQSAKMLEAAGADAITVSSYHDNGQLKLHSHSNIPHPPGLNLPSAARIKSVLNIPVITSGRVEPEVAEAGIARGDFDFLGMGRKLLADPHLPRKLHDGRREDIRPCIYCYTCVSAIYHRDPVRCAVNPATGFEYQLRAPVHGVKKRYVVVGGGPGGMEAARRLDEQGHEVILLEATARLGGTLQFASLAYEPNERLLEWLRRGIAGSKVQVRLNTRADAAMIRSLKPDAVLVANGPLRGMPDIPGAELDHVLSGDDLRALMMGQQSPELTRKVGLPSRLITRTAAALGLTADLEFVRRTSHMWMPLGKRVVVIGGGLVGLELAEFLHERGRHVTVVDDVRRFGSGLLLVRRMRVLEELKEAGVGLYPGAQEIRIEPDAVHFKTGKKGSEQAHAIAADHVIAAKGAEGNSTVADSLRAAGLNVIAFGDCTGIGYIEGAIRGAADAVAGLQA